MNLTDFNHYNQLCIYMFNSSTFLPALFHPTRFPAGNQHHIPSTLDHVFFLIIYKYFFSSKYKLFPNVSNELGKIEFQPFSIPSYEKLVAKVRSIDWNALVRLTIVDMSFHLFIDIINALYCKCFPVKVKYLSKKYYPNHGFLLLFDSN